MSPRLLAALGVLVLAASACAAPASADGEVLADAVETTLGEETARVDIVTTVRRSSSDDPEDRYRGNGLLDFTNGRAAWTFEPGVLPGTVDSDLGFEGRVEAVADDLVLYLRAPLPGGAHWLMVDLRARALTEADGLGGPLHGNDPGTHLHLLRGADADVEEVGRETIRGVPTTRYTATVDLDEAVTATPRPVRAGVERTVAHLGVPSLPVQVWVDDAGRVRRLAYEVELHRRVGDGRTLGAEVTGTVATTLEYFDFGGGVAISPPADDDVVRVDGPVSDFDGFEAQLGPEGAET